MTTTLNGRAFRALTLSAVATAGSIGAIAAGAAPRLSGAVEEQAKFLCGRTEFGRAEIRALQRSAEFPQLLTYALETCPAVASVLSDGAPASVRTPTLPGKDDVDRRPGGRPDSDGGNKGI